MYNVKTNVQDEHRTFISMTGTDNHAELFTFTRGNKFFELSNHLGNVLVTISDRKLPVYNQSLDAVTYYKADVVTASDYFPGGMLMPGRNFKQAGSDYRYSINGQEKEKELNENITTALYWEYDSRILRRWNIDPEVKDNESPYLCFGANPIFFSDLLGNQPGGTQPGPKQPEPVNLTASQTSAAITTALFAVHQNTMEKRNYFVSSLAPENKQPIVGADLYDTNPENVASLFGLKKEQVSEFAKVYKNYYNNFATIGMWFDGTKTVEELYKAMEQVPPGKQYKLANALLKTLLQRMRNGNSFLRRALLLEIFC